MIHAWVCYARRYMFLINRQLDQSTAQPTTDRAEQLQLLFSRQYDANWLKKFEPTR
jgi:hypothetical protein